MTCLFVGIGLVNAQISKVTGTVISEEDGLPIVGASIVVKGTSTGTITDMDGKFTLENLPNSAKTLMVSFIGLRTQEVAIQSIVNVVLKPEAEILDELVVTAMGIKRDRKALGYAAQDLKAEQLNKSGTTSLASAIQGRLTGVDIR